MIAFEVGQELAPHSFEIDRKLLVAYANASGDHNPIHQNEEFAKSVGLPDVIAHGDIAGGSANVKEFFARFTKPVVVPADTVVQLIVSAKVVSVEAGLAKIEIQAMCNNIKVLGMAKAVISLL
jgi:acyl dehydratase